MNFFNYEAVALVCPPVCPCQDLGDIWLIILLGLLCNIIIIAAGYFVSYHAPNSLQVTRYLMLLSVPFFAISGYTWPYTHIPEYSICWRRHFLSPGWQMVSDNLRLGFAYIKPNVVACR